MGVVENFAPSFSPLLQIPQHHPFWAVICTNYHKHVYNGFMNTYHHSPTPKQIKLIKQLRAAEMKKHTDAMKQISAKYEPILSKLEKLRSQEVTFNGIQQRLTPEQIEKMTAVLLANRKKAGRIVAKFTGVNDISS